MRAPRKRGVAAVALFLFAASARAEAPPAVLPAIRLETAAGEAVPILDEVPRARLEALARYLGLERPGPPLRVVVVPEDHRVAQETLPEIAGFALAHDGVAVLFPARVRTYPYEGSLVVLYLHELTHLLLARATGGRPVPRWYDEGVALVASRDWTFSDRSRVLATGLVALPESLAELEGAFRPPSRAGLAYSLAGELVRRLVEAGGDDVVATINRRMAAGEGFEDAVSGALGEPLAVFAARFWRTQRIWTRWVPFVASGTVFWLGITALALAAGVRRRRRDAEQRRRWEREELDDALRELETSETVH